MLRTPGLRSRVGRASQARRSCRADLSGPPQSDAEEELLSRIAVLPEFSFEPLLEAVAGSLFRELDELFEIRVIELAVYQQVSVIGHEEVDDDCHSLLPRRVEKLIDSELYRLCLPEELRAVVRTDREEVALHACVGIVGDPPRARHAELRVANSDPCRLPGRTGLPADMSGSEGPGRAAPRRRNLHVPGLRDPAYKTPDLRGPAYNVPELRGPAYNVRPAD